MNLTGVHLGSYWMGKNDVVYLMAHELKIRERVELIDTEIYSGNQSKWYREELKSGHAFPVRWIDHEKLKRLIEKHKSDYVIVTAGGMAISEQTSEWLRKRKIVSVGIELSDPDVFGDNGKIYGNNFDLFYTNSLYSLINQYPASSKYHHLPFAASPSLHKPMSGVVKQYEVVIVGHARPERIKVVEELRKYFHVKTYGSGWGGENNEVHGANHAKAINSGKIYLSFAQTYAGYNNVKVGLFEAAACRICIVTSFTSEMKPLFMYGVDIVGYKSEKDLIDAVRYCLENQYYREWIAENSYQKLLKEHTWQSRWDGIMGDIYALRK